MIFLHFTEDGKCHDASVQTNGRFKPDKGIATTIKHALDNALDCGGYCAAIYGHSVNDVLNEMEEESVDLPEITADSVHAVLLQLKKEVNS